MPIEIKSYESDATIVTKTQLQTAEVLPGVFAFKHNVNTTVSGQDGTMRTTRPAAAKKEQQGLIDEANLKRLVKGVTWKPSETHWVLTAEGREIIRTKGRNCPDKDRARLNAAVPKDVFDAFVDGRLTSADVIITDPKMYVSFTSDGKVLPEVVRFDYISNGRVTNRNYDLEKLVAHLLPRDDIHFFPGKNNFRDDVVYEGKAATVKEAILNIPYYNRDGGRDHTVEFLWSPSQEAYQQLFDALVAGKDVRFGMSEIHKKIFDLDVLGLRACGAALCEDYYGDTLAPDEDDRFDM